MPVFRPATAYTQGIYINSPLIVLCGIVKWVEAAIKESSDPVECLAARNIDDGSLLTPTGLAAARDPDDGSLLIPTGLAAAKDPDDGSLLTTTVLTAAMNPDAGSPLTHTGWAGATRITDADDDEDD